MVIGSGKGKKNLELGSVLINDFDDNYHKLTNDPTTDLAKAARKIRRRYRSYQQYQQAKDTFNDYIEQLIIKHNGVKHFSMLLAAGAIEDFIPPEPKLKNSAINKTIMEHGIMISDPHRLKIDTDIANEIFDMMDDNLDKKYKKYYDLNIEEKKDKHLSKIMENASKSSRKKLTSSRAIREEDCLALLASYTSSYSKDSKKKKKKEKDVSLTEIINRPDDYVDEDEEEALVYCNGRYITPKEKAEYDMYATFREAGWNSVSIMKSAGKKAINRDILDSLEEQDYKDKLKRKDKKKRDKKKKKKDKEDDFLIRVMGDSGSFEDMEDLEEDMLNMTMANIFGK